MCLSLMSAVLYNSTPSGLTSFTVVHSLQGICCFFLVRVSFGSIKGWNRIASSPCNVSLVAVSEVAQEEGAACLIWSQSCLVHKT